MLEAGRNVLVMNEYEAPFTRGRLRVKTTKYFIGSAFRLDGDSVFRV